MDYAQARRNMIDCQLRTNKVTDDALLEAMGTLPREEFVPAALRAKSYSDCDIGISATRSMMAPMTLARMFQCLKISRGDVALVVGSSSGYAAAVMGQIARVVFALESNAENQEQIGSLYTSLGLDNVVSVTGPLEKGWAKEAPYDVIYVDGAVESLPDELFEQLGDGGRLVAVVVENGIGRATRFIRKNARNSGSVIFDANAQLFAEFSQPQDFVF
jgi:protein-L-isoaspartate(D-aspartate) O-methyltransferase